MGKKFWLVGYSMKQNGHQYAVVNTVVDQHPLDFLLHLNETYSGCGNVIHFSLEISEEQYEKAKDDM